MKNTIIETRHKKKYSLMIYKNIFSKILLSLIMVTIGVAMVLPLAWMLSSSFKYESDIFNMPIEWIPINPIIDNFKHALQDFPYMQWYANTFISTACVVLLVLLISSLAGYSFAKMDFPGKNILFFLFIATMMIPVQVRIIPQFMMFKSVHLTNHLGSIIVGWSYNAFSIFMMRQFFTSVPNELLEAARIDGSSEIKIFFKIVLPIARPQLSALGILAFTWGWNQYLAPLIFIRDPKRQVLSVGISMFKSMYTDNYAVQMAGATLALLPVIIVYLALQKHLIEGIALSGLKG